MPAVELFEAGSRRDVFDIYDDEENQDEDCGPGWLGVTQGHVEDR